MNIRRMHNRVKILQALEKSEDALPWYTYPAIEFLRQMDLSTKTVFEYGSGNSTLWWAARCKQLVTVEDNHAWGVKITSLGLPRNVRYRMRTLDPNRYIRSISEGRRRKFDIIVIDGSHRYECAQMALPFLRNDGFIILDNSDWLPKTSKFLRDAGLIEVHMSGFGPINGYTTTTSFYFRSGVKLPCSRPSPIGGLPHTVLEEL